MLLQLVLIILSGLFAAAQTSLLSLNDAKLRHDAEEGDPEAEKLLRVAEAPDGYLAALQVSVTLAGFTGAAFCAHQLAPRLASAVTGWGMAPDAAGTLCLVLVTLLLAVITLILGVMVPQRFAMHQPEKTARATFGVMRFFAAVLRPLVWLLSAAANGILRLAGIDPNAETEEVTEEEIRQMVDMGGETGAIEETEKEMIENIFEFNNLSAEDVMTHRTDVTSIWIGDDHEAVLKTIRESGLSRFPVYDQDMDDIVGILSTRSFLLNTQAPQPRPMRELIRDAYFVPETVQADALFREMQKRKIHLAVVVDEYGGMSGIVTMEDLLEEIVGNIYDETDREAVAEILPVEDNLWRIAGTASLEDVAEALEIELPLEEEYDTLGGLIFNQFTTIPQDGSTPEVDVAGLHIRVEKIEEHRVEMALVSKLEIPDEDEKPTEVSNEVSE